MSRILPEYGAGIICRHSTSKKTITALENTNCSVTLELCKKCQEKPQFKKFFKIKEKN